MASHYYIQSHVTGICGYPVFHLVQVYVITYSSHTTLRLTLKPWTCADLGLHAREPEHMNASKQPPGKA